VQVRDNSPLAPLTTFGLGGPARRLVTAEREMEVVESVREIDSRGDPLLVLGGGSNLVIADAGFQGSVLRIATRGRRFERSGGGEKVLVTVQAGESWDELVRIAVEEEGLAGLECLGGIPGLVGAVPMQNVGAYGQDVSETIVKLRAYDRQRHEVVTIDRASCAFAYRTSAFRGRDRHVILEVTFALEKKRESRPIRYLELARALGIEEGETAPLATVRSTVIALRRKKGMVVDSADLDTQSAGSFFTNPILTPDAVAEFRERAKDEGPIPIFPEADGRSKVSAGWLIEHAGFKKGHKNESGRVSLSTKHALALTNRGGATADEIVSFARMIRDGVRVRFGVTLENEPVFVGVRL
jgi:UDP-N-acetylmuramate dehydrogenase